MIHDPVMVFADGPNSGQTAYAAAQSDFSVGGTAQSGSAAAAADAKMAAETVRRANQEAATAVPPSADPEGPQNRHQSAPHGAAAASSAGDATINGYDWHVIHVSPHASAKLTSKMLIGYVCLSDPAAIRSVGPPGGRRGGGGGGGGDCHNCRDPSILAIFFCNSYLWHIK